MRRAQCRNRERRCACPHTRVSTPCSLRTLALTLSPPLFLSPSRPPSFALTSMQSPVRAGACCSGPPGTLLQSTHTNRNSICVSSAGLGRPEGRRAEGERRRRKKKGRRRKEHSKEEGGEVAGGERDWREGRRREEGGGRKGRRREEGGGRGEGGKRVEGGGREEGGWREGRRREGGIPAMYSERIMRGCSTVMAPRKSTRPLWRSEEQSTGEWKEEGEEEETRGGGIGQRKWKQRQGSSWVRPGTEHQ
eukprot:3902901-Rhodomonas_salina.1